MQANSRRYGLWAMVVFCVCAGRKSLHAQSFAVGVEHEFRLLIEGPLLSGALGIIGAFIAIRFDARKTTNQELIKKRIELYDLVAPKLNDFLCFFLSIGTWRALPPTLMIQKKRELDRMMFIYGPLFKAVVFDQYYFFMRSCFRMNDRVGSDARLRANRSKIEREWEADWISDWNDHFVSSDEVTHDEDIRREHNKLLMLLASEIGAVRGNIFLN